MNLLGAIGDVNNKMELTGGHIHSLDTSPNEHHDRHVSIISDLPGINDLTEQVEGLESGDKRLQLELGGLAAELDNYTQKLKQNAVRIHIMFCA